MAAVLEWIAANWRTILTLIGLGVAAVAAYSLGSALIQAQPAITQAVSIAAYVIPLMAYMFAFQMIFASVRMIMDVMRSLTEKVTRR